MMLRYFWKQFCEVFDFLSATHARRSSTYSLVSGEKGLICLIFAVCHSTHLFLLLLRGSGSFGFESLRSHSSLFPASQLPYSHFYGYRLVYSINSLDSFGSFSFSSLSNLYIPVLFFQSLISCPLSSNSSTFPALLWHIFIPTGFFFLSDCRRCFPFSPNGHFLFSHSRLLTLSHINNDNNNDNFISFFFFLFFCTLFGHRLSKSSHVSHHSLNGLSPTITSSRSHSCSPSPLSISLGGPAFLPGFSRPQCENWRWRGRRWRRDNHWSRPQSVFLVTNCRASLSSC